MTPTKLTSLIHTTCCALLCLGAAACTTDSDPTPLPPGKYPLELTAGGLQAMVEQASTPTTRGTTDNNWDGVRTVAVQVGGEVKEYTVASSGNKQTASLTAAAPFYWQTSGERKSIVAWHPYSTAYPKEWKVKADQNAEGNYVASDLIRGDLTLSFVEKDIPEKRNIPFIHQTAKVKIDLTAGAGVTLGGAVSVQLLNVDGVEGGGSAVTPYRPNDAEHSYLALLTPQTIAAAKQFFRVSVDGNDFYYTPTSEVVLTAGKEYTYAITVKANGIEVTMAKGGEWGTNGSEEAITSKVVVAEYAADDIKPGDYFYRTAEGGWEVSDGGLRKVYADGTMGWAETKPKPDDAKGTCIGIVFHAGRHDKDGANYSTALTDGGPCIADNIVHGYVVALKDATESKCMWGKPGKELGFYPKDSDGKALDNYNHPDIDWEGYRYTQTIINTVGGAGILNAEAEDGYPATYYAVVNYAKQVPAPTNSSGWFLPAIGQMRQVFQQRENLKFTDASGNNLRGDYYWSSSEYYYRPSELALSVRVSDGFVNTWSKNYGCWYVRAVLAF